MQWGDRGFDLSADPRHLVDLRDPSGGHDRTETDDRQKASTVCTIGTQPVIPAVYGVKAPL
jgi:hypothetical protein